MDDAYAGIASTQPPTITQIRMTAIVPSSGQMSDQSVDCSTSGGDEITYGLQSVGVVQEASSGGGEQERLFEGPGTWRRGLR